MQSFLTGDNKLFWTTVTKGIPKGGEGLTPRCVGAPRHDSQRSSGGLRVNHGPRFSLTAAARILKLNRPPCPPRGGKRQRARSRARRHILVSRAAPEAGPPRSGRPRSGAKRAVRKGKDSGSELDNFSLDAPPQPLLSAFSDCPGRIHNRLRSSTKCLSRRANRKWNREPRRGHTRLFLRDPKVCRRQYGNSSHTFRPAQA
jgi:hypothetical protein